MKGKISYIERPQEIDILSSNLDEIKSAMIVTKKTWSSPLGFDLPPLIFTTNKELRIGKINELKIGDATFRECYIGNSMFDGMTYTYTLNGYLVEIDFTMIGEKK